MTAPQEQPPPGNRRRLFGVLAAVVLIAAAFIVITRLDPAAPAPEPAANSGTPAPAPAPASAQPKADTPVAASVPAGSGAEFTAWATKMGQWLDIPSRALVGYAKATTTLGEQQPDCHLSWVTLAAIGKVSSDHGRAQGAMIGANGTLSKPLNTVEVKDFYGTVVSTADASGPMQLSPALWSKWQRAAGNAKPDRQNVDDAALTTGRALCDGGRNLGRGEDWVRAVSTLQEAPLFQHRVLATANVYGTVGKGSAAPKGTVLTAVNFAIDKIGLPYVWGGNGEQQSGGFDCSGLTTAAYASGGIGLKRTADWQFHSVQSIGSGSAPQLGDLIFYGEPSTKIHHVGIYIGNEQMIDAPTFGQAVQVHPYRKPGDDYAGAGRPTA